MKNNEKYFSDQLTIHLCGPMQCYGRPKTGNTIRTCLKPTKSAITGILGCCAGIPRKDPRLKEISGSFAIVDIQAFHTPSFHSPLRPKKKVETLTDFQSVRDPDDTDSKPIFVYVEYIIDTYFQVTIAASPETIKQFKKWLDRPQYPACLGRKCCIPSMPFHIEPEVIAELFPDAAPAGQAKDDADHG